MATFVNGNGGTLSASLACTAGNLVVGVVSLFDTVTCSISDGTNSLTQIDLISLAGDGDSMRTFYYRVPTTATLTFTVVTASGEDRAIAVVQFSGMLSSGTLLDQKSTVKDATGTSATTNASSTTTQADEIAIGFFGNTLGGTVTYTAGGGWTLGAQAQSGDQMACAIVYQVLSATGAQTASATLSASKEYGAQVATFFGSGGGGGGGSTSPYYYLLTLS